jgi:hypothetical protein
MTVTDRGGNITGQKLDLFSGIGLGVYNVFRNYYDPEGFGTIWFTIYIFIPLSVHGGAQ